MGISADVNVGDAAAAAGTDNRLSDQSGEGQQLHRPTLSAGHRCDYTPGAARLPHNDSTKASVSWCCRVLSCGSFVRCWPGVSRQLANESARLAQLADDIDSTIALTTHTRTQAQRRLHLTDIPAEPMSIVLALSDPTAVGRLKATARHLRNALRPIIRRIRLRKAIECAGVGGVVRFDDQLCHGDVMKAMWVVEEGGEGGWGEAADTLRFAEHFGYCQLPVTVGAGDLQIHASKAEY
ncbi:unnamed protein product [Vitrella brassicaformis CCMP3155]|uniref:Uncharacterized protein n=1 Tax=Vitrella brassicaformis (strain CCMP3155) TaxID=1169540 RepID=A0A0G4GBP7_VITBC|nr:unnamed protein product [Vitrella brassicaformis CCMP3155]|eukprot:CEM26520.1 unnamed protein product [Vitrella brassicaformis CCMP3155]